jgi:dipeptidyl aminopeptidase/acylaminoacyl peptidase
VVSSRVTIVGTGFGSAQGNGYLTFGGATAVILSWADTSITARVPLLPTASAESNSVQVAVVVGGSTVGAGSFTVVRGILYCAKRGPRQVICLANPDGGETFDLTVDGTSGYPQWSPDGTKVAFVRGGGSAYAGDIYVVNADGSGEARLTDTGDNANPAWSPNGTRLVFSSSRDGNGEIYVMDADGFGQTNLSHYSGSDWFPSWSPDGKRIAFNRNVAVHPVDYRVFVMDADGSD